MGERSQRRRIIEAMLASCAAKTYAGTTISDIVSRARISRSTFYKRFADKRACFDASLAHCIEILRDTASGAPDPGDTPIEAVRRAIAAVLKRIAERPAIGQLLTADAVAVEPTVIDRYRELAVPAVARLLAGASSGETHSDPDLAFARARLLIFNEIAGGGVKHVQRLLPELTYLAVAPFAGHDEALRQSQLAERSLKRDLAAAAGDGDGGR